MARTTGRLHVERGYENHRAPGIIGAHRIERKGPTMRCPCCGYDLDDTAPCGSEQKSEGDHSALHSFWDRWERDKVDDMTEEQWGQWVNALPRAEFLEMIALPTD